MLRLGGEWPWQMRRRALVKLPAALWQPKLTSVSSRRSCRCFHLALRPNDWGRGFTEPAHALQLPDHVCDDLLTDSTRKDLSNSGLSDAADLLGASIDDPPRTARL